MKNSLITAIIISATLIINCFSQKVGWEVIQSNTTQDLNSIFFFDHQFGFACGDSGTVLKSIDSGKTWQSIQSPVNFDLNDCYIFAQDCFEAVGDSASWIHTSDGGNTWFSTQILDLFCDIYSMSFYRNQSMSYGIYGADSQKIMFGDNIYCSGIIIDVFGGSPGGFWGTYMLTDKIGFAAGENSIVQPILGRTTDGGSSWDYISFYLGGNEGRATGVAFTDSLNGYISAFVWDGGGAISKTIDNGDTWTTKFFVKPLRDINFPISGKSQVGYCVGDSGIILKTFNAGVTWYNQFSGTLKNLNQVYFVDSDFGFAVGENGIILRTTDGGGITSITDDKDSGVLNFELQQNYPNPFNPTTKIGWHSPVGSWQTLKIFDLLGNEIATLVDEEKLPGTYEVKFNASNLTSGVYFYQLQAGEYIQVKKMILLR